uniref:Si:dkey-16l2.20 n=1 Tax=Cynoglossus semilaevis TaxID=244447 RepID=A0A3P8X6U9_CYNSE
MEDIPLNTTPGSGGSEDEVMSSKMGKRGAASFFTDQHYRRLAICSIICGCSCIGIKSLINSVKAEEAGDQIVAAKYSQRARKFGIISILTWFLCLAAVPILMTLGSYLLTLKD